MESNQLNHNPRNMVVDGNGHAGQSVSRRCLRTSENAQSVIGTTLRLFFPRHGDVESNPVQVGAQAQRAGDSA